MLVNLKVRKVKKLHPEDRKKQKEQTNIFPTVKNIWKSYIWTADKDVNESDPRSNVHYLGSSENKAWKKFRPVQDLNLFYNQELP